MHQLHTRFFQYALFLLTTSLLFSASASVSASVTDYSIDWVAAAPASYDHHMGGGAYDDRTLRTDVANALVGNDFQCGDIVSFFAQVAVDAPASAETLEFAVVFQANSQAQPGIGYVDIVNVAVNYGDIVDLVSGENQIDDGISDDGGSSATLVDKRFEPASGPVGGSLYENPATTADLIGIVRLDDLEATDSAIVVRVDAKLDCLRDSNPNGFLTAELRDATLVEPLSGPLPIGIQNVILSAVDKVTFPPDTADLTVVQSAPSIVAPGSPLTYTVVFTNQGPNPALNPQITNTLPPSVTYQSLSMPAGWHCLTPAVGETGAIGCQEANFDVGAVVTMTIGTATAPTLPLATILTNTAAITATTFDPNGPNRAIITTMVRAPRLYATKQGTMLADLDQSGFLSPGDRVAYTITIENHGNLPATNVVLSDTLATMSTLIVDSLQTTAGSFMTVADPTGAFAIDVGTLGIASTPVTITYQVAVTTALPMSMAAGNLINQATIFSDAEEPIGTDDPATAAAGDPTILVVKALAPYFPCMGIPDNECAALQALYIETNGAFWRHHDGWFATTDPCTWYGLTCQLDPDGMPHITAIELKDNALQGILPAAIGDLTELVRLDLSSNSLAAAIPAAIGELAHLEYLNLSENIFVAELPATLGNLTSLRELILYGNNFSGDLPAELLNLSALERFLYQQTALCQPEDPALLAWLTRVSLVAGTTVSDCRYIDHEAKPLVLVYAGLDNNLSNEWGKLVNNLELGTDTDAFTVRLLIDGYGDKNSYEYILAHDDDPTCPSIITGYLECNRYRRGVTVREQIEDTAQRDLLTMFLVNALYEQPNATQVILILVGHGSGWGANGLPAQPRGWTEQTGPFSDIAGGMLWDDTPGDGTLSSRSLSTRALGEALRQAKKLTGKGVDLLYLDACSMAMAEVVYEVQDSVDYLLASENVKWATFPYDLLLPYVGQGLDAQTIGERWLATEVSLLSRVTTIDFTFSLLSPAGMTEIVSATNALVDLLQPLLPAQLTLIDQTLAATAFFDSNYDGVVDHGDTYLDLYDFAGQLALTFADNPALVAASTRLQEAIRWAVIREFHQNSDRAMLAASPWNELGGLSVYWPIAADEEKRLTLYSDLNLRWAADSTWDEWLSVYWQSAEDRRLTELEQCDQTAQCPGLTGWGFVDIPPGQLIFIPLVQNAAQ